MIFSFTSALGYQDFLEMKMLHTNFKELETDQLLALQPSSPGRNHHQAGIQNSSFYPKKLMKKN